MIVDFLDDDDPGIPGETSTPTRTRHNKAKVRKRYLARDLAERLRSLADVVMERSSEDWSDSTASLVEAKVAGVSPEDYMLTWIHAEIEELAAGPNDNGAAAFRHGAFYNSMLRKFPQIENYEAEELRPVLDRAVSRMGKSGRSPDKGGWVAMVDIGMALDLFVNDPPTPEALRKRLGRARKKLGALGLVR